MVSTHGCTFALTAGDALAAPILDYEQPVPPEIDRQFQAEAPAFAESFTPNLPGGLNVARHIYLREQLAPEMFRQADAILNYPQFWNWLLTGAKVSEISSIGCHSHLWRPREDTFSSLVDKRGWRAKFPPFRRAGDVLGEARIGAQSVPVHNGVHDSNAALYYYRSLGYSDVTLISTGTWVITFNQACPLDALDPQRDMLANVTVDRAPIPTARFMGGREYDVIAGSQAPVSRETLQRAIDRGQFALPSFAAGGPYPGAQGFADRSRAQQRRRTRRHRHALCRADDGRGAGPAALHQPDRAGRRPRPEPGAARHPRRAAAGPEPLPQRRRRRHRHGRRRPRARGARQAPGVRTADAGGKCAGVEGAQRVSRRLARALRNRLSTRTTLLRHPVLGTRIRESACSARSRSKKLADGRAKTTMTWSDSGLR